MNATCLEAVDSAVQLATLSEPLAVHAARSACGLERSIQRFTATGDQNLGHLEVQAAQDVQNLLRETVQRGAQAKADNTPPLCPVCHQKLTRLSADHPRSFDTRFGPITVQRTRGYCKRCRKWGVPADTALGLAETAGYSPGVQEMAALLASKMPVEGAAISARHPKASMGTDAGTLPDDHPDGRLEHPRARSLGPERRRAARHQRARLRGHTHGPGRPARATARRSFAARLGPGCGRAGHQRWCRVDLAAGRRPLSPKRGSGWIFTMPSNTWPPWAGPYSVRTRPSSKAWLKPLVQQLKNQSALKVIGQLEEARAQRPGGPVAEAVQKEVHYFHEHQDRMDYQAGQRRGEPIGSGPVEATCRQNQCRFKRPGQFCSQTGEEALLGLEMFRRHDRWNLLFPHTSLDPARN